MIREDHKIDGSNGAYFLGRLTGTSISLSSIVDEYRGRSALIPGITNDCIGTPPGADLTFPPPIVGLVRRD